MPYLALSRQKRGQYHPENDNCEGKQSQNEREKEDKGGKQEGENDGTDRKEVELQGAYDAYHGLLKCYEGNVIHGSATLDESFYGFSRLAQQQEALHEDRPQRNEHQVVTKSIHPEGVAERSDWTIVRVNQLWVWVIGHSMSTTPALRSRFC